MIDKVTEKIYGNNKDYCTFSINFKLDTIRRTYQKALETNNLYMFVCILADIGELRQMCSQEGQKIMRARNIHFASPDDFSAEEAEYLMTVRFVNELEDHVASACQCLRTTNSLAEAVQAF